MSDVVVRRVSNEDIDQLMAASMLADSAKDIIMKIIIIPDIEISDEKFKILLDDYTDKYMYYELLKTKIAKRYLLDGEDYMSWSIDFNSRKITFIKRQVLS